jgi:hypothetical protein
MLQSSPHLKYFDTLKYTCSLTHNSLLAHALQVMEACHGADEKMGADILLRSMSAPVMQIAYNAGVEGGVVYAKTANKVRETCEHTYSLYNESSTPRPPTRCAKRVNTRASMVYEREFTVQ